MTDWKVFLKKYWAAIAVSLIILLAVQVRTLDYRWPYLRNIDSYIFYRHMNEIVQNGGIMPNYDNLILAPEGNIRNMELFPYQYLGAWTYMFFHLFLQNMQLWQYLIYFPAVLASLAAIPVYYIGKTLYDRKAGVLAAFFIVLDISNVSRSLAGDPDTDAIVIIMPLIVMTAFLFAYKYIDSRKAFDKKAALLSVITGALLGLWAHTWIGYWYIVWLITGLFVLKFAIDFIRMRNIRHAWNGIKYFVYSYAIFMLILFIFIYPFYGLSRIFYTFTGPLEFQSIKSEENREFPNVYVSVAELQASGNIRDIIQRTSAISFSSNPLALLASPFFLMICGLAYLMYSYYRKGQHADTAVLLLIWFIGPLLATIMAVRFSILFSAPIAIGSAIFLSKALRMATGEDKSFGD